MNCTRAPRDLRFLLPVTRALLLLLLTVGTGQAAEVRSSRAERRMEGSWLREHLLAPKPGSGGPAFSFVFEGRSSEACLRAWPATESRDRLDGSRRRHTRTWTDPRTGLEVRCVAVEYEDFPVAEWTVYFRNTGRADTPILERIEALDTRFERTEAGEFRLRGTKGDWCVPQSFEPWELTLGPGATERFAPDGGRPTNGPRGWPFYNLAMPGGGVILAVGWPGQWQCTFTRDAGRGLRVVAGQELTRLYLQPGEEIRTPLVAMLFWQGTDVMRSQNLWRRWMLAHNVPRPNGRPLPTLLQMQCYRTFEKGGEEDLFETVNEFNRAGIAVDLCWRDAGWYPCRGSWPNTGTWEVDARRYPHGWRPFSDWLHGQGKEFIVWFEPERVGDPNSWLAMNHPDWILGGRLLDLGNPEAWRWLVGHVDGLIREHGIDHYRQDFNMDPLSYWRGHDTPDRQGMTEIGHVTGYLAFWDELRRRHPGMLIDSCASGGRRNDLETLRRSVPLLRSDFQFGREATTPNQGHTYGISGWIPYYGSGCYFTEPYDARSYIMPCSGYAGSSADTKRAYDECRRVAPYMLGDYYPLTPYSIRPGDWIAWQFDRPERGDGVIQAFRRERSDSSSQPMKLRALTPSARYEITGLDGGPRMRRTGRELMAEGLPVEITARPGAVVLFYQRVRGGGER